MNSAKKRGNNFRKRQPPKTFTRKNDFYVTKKTDIRATLKKCEEILNSPEYDQIYLHCIGAAINRGINLALKLAEDYNFKFEANTSTINLVGKLRTFRFYKNPVKF
jgi:ribonuclease P/MRP protein subunit RPP20